MIVPRRVRRRLLLPPGWVALGFLLLLGCQALQPWERQLKQWSVMQLTMPPLKVDTSYTRFLREYRTSKHKNELDIYATPLPIIPASALQKMRPWHTVNFYGNRLADFFSAATTESAVRKIIADTANAGGVRIRFQSGAIYANLVTVLDIMSYVNQKKYFLDIHHRPITLYAITNRPSRTKPVVSFSCGTRYLELREPLAKVDWREALEGYWRALQMLANQQWRTSAVLLVVIISLSCWQLSRSRVNSTYS
jgi:hypothetical protein